MAGKSFERRMPQERDWWQFEKQIRHRCIRSSSQEHRSEAEILTMRRKTEQHPCILGPVIWLHNGNGLLQPCVKCFLCGA